MEPVVTSATDETWVSKTDLITYLRCPYSFYLLYKGLINFEDTLNEQQAKLIDDGVAFQSEIESTIPPADSSDLHQLFSKESIRLFNIPLLKDDQLRIMGRPDAVDTRKGELVPIEIKLHKNVRVSDKLELAFYWLLLEPYRTKHSLSPRGVLLLNHNDRPEEVDVEIRPQYVQRVHQLLQDIRTARVKGVSPKKCKCQVCSKAMAEMVDLRFANGSLQLIQEMRPQYLRCLEEFGVVSYEELRTANTDIIVAKFQEEGYNVSPERFNGWKHHATSYATGRIVVFGDPPPLQNGFLALDLEYVPETSFVWLIGLCIVDKNDNKRLALWADDESEEISNLNKLTKLLSTYDPLPIVTWSGRTADVPCLKKAAHQLDIKDLMDILESRHLDLREHFKKAVRIPWPWLGLKEVGRALNLPRSSSVTGGLQAIGLYNEYLKSRSKTKRSKLKKQLLQYNREDVNTLVGVATRLASMKRTEP